MLFEAVVNSDSVGEHETVLTSKLLQRTISKKKRKKSGELIKQDFEDSLYLYALFKISRALQSESYHPNLCKPEELANISYTLQSFGEAEFGLSSTRSQRAMTKLCAKHFRDLSIGGSLHHIFKTALKFMANSKSLSFIMEDKDLGVKLMKEIEATLISKGFLKRHRIYLHNLPDGVYKQLSGIVKSHGAELLTSSADATHIVCWDEEVDNMSEELQEEFIRTVDYRHEHQGGVARVHWWYHPDSYDEWIPAVDVDAFEPPDVLPTGDVPFGKQWNVCCRFLLDVDRFNEWGNENDYENIVEGDAMDDYATSVPVESNDYPDRMDAIDDIDEGAANNLDPINATKRRGRRRTKGISKGDVVAKSRREAPIPEAVIGLEKMMADLKAPTLDLNRQVLKVVTLDPRSPSIVTFSEEAPNSAEVKIDACSPATDCRDLAETNARNKRKNPSGSKTHKEKKVMVPGADKYDLINLPDWFNPDKLHEIETAFLDTICKRGVSDDMRSEYRSIRNFIVALYPQVSRNGLTYLSATECRRKISGDASFVYSVHSFLDANRLINYFVRSDQRLQVTPHRSAGQLDVPLLVSAGVVHMDCTGGIGTVAIARLHPVDASNPFESFIADPESSSSSSYKSVTWSKSLDGLLVKAVGKLGLKWEEVSREMIKVNKNSAYTANACLRYVFSPTLTHSLTHSLTPLIFATNYI